MEIHEISRFDQLVGNGHSVVDAALINYGVTVESLAEEIASKVDIAFKDGSYVENALWYVRANYFAQTLANDYGTTIEIAAGVISAVSPRMPWLRNKKVASAILAEFEKYDHLSAIEAAKEIGLALSANVAMAVKIARGESISDTLSGTKRRSFYNNIVSPHGIDSVTVDTWMMMAYCNISGSNKKMAENFVRANRTALSGTGVGYYAIAEATRVVAKQRNMPANAIQAIYWCQVAGSSDGGRSDIN